MHMHAQNGTLTRGADGALYLLSPGSCVRVQGSPGDLPERHLEAEAAVTPKYEESAGWQSAAGDQASARMLVDPGDQLSARMLVDPGDQASARMLVDPGDQLSARMLIDPGESLVN